MALKAEEKQRIIAEYATHEGDTGSPEVQVALLSARIKELTEHFRSHPHDHHSRRGLMLLIGQRKRLLAYLAEADIARAAFRHAGRIVCLPVGAALRHKKTRRNPGPGPRWELPESVRESPLKAVSGPIKGE